MRMRTWCAAALLSCSMPASAQTPLTEADALARLSPDSPRMRAISAGVSVARAEARAAARWPNPRVTVNRESVAAVTEHIVTVTQPLPITGRHGLEVQAAAALADASAHRADDAIRQARAELRVAYADLVATQQKEVALTRSRDRLRELAGVLARREAAGDAAGYDRLRAEREVSDMEAELVMTSLDRARAQAVLGSFFGTADDVTTITAVAPAENRPPLPTVDDLLAKARSTRGEFAALQKEIASARFAQQAADRRLLPEPEVVAGTKSSNAGIGDVGPVVGIHIAIPLFDRGQPERALAIARREAAAANTVVLETSLRAQITTLRTVVAERRAAAERYRDSATAGADTLERIAQVSYDAGERGILELLDAYRGGAAVRTQQAVLDAAVRQAEIQLEFVSGWEIR